MCEAINFKCDRIRLMVKKGKEAKKKNRKKSYSSLDLTIDVNGSWWEYEVKEETKQDNSIMCDEQFR